MNAWPRSSHIPSDLTQHGVSACFAALHLAGALQEYASEIKRERGLHFAVRMGINSGDVVVGRIGDDLRMDYTALGHTVGMAPSLNSCPV